MQAYREYKMLLDNGILEELYPELSGNWEEDKKLFINILEMNELFTKKIDVDYEEE